jgi:hypothetical protein
MRNKKDSKCPHLYKDFGSILKDTDPNILYTVSRSFIVKTFGLCMPSEIETLTSVSEIEKRIKEFSLKNEVDVFTNGKCREVMHALVYN